MSQHPEPSAPDYLPVSLVAEMAYCPRNFYYRMVEAWDDVTSADMLKGKGPRPGDLAGQVLTPRDLGRTLYVDEQGACVRKRQGQLVVEKHGERILAVPLTLAKAFVASKLTNMRVRIQRTRRSRDMPKLKAADGQLLDALDGVLWRVRSFHSKEGGKARAIARRRLHAMSSAFQRSGRPRSCARQARGATGCAPAATIAFKQPVEGASVVLHALRAIALGGKASSPSTSPATRHSPPAMTHLLVAYDIVDDKRRTRVFKTLARFGQHVQFSLFECFLDDKELLTMQHKVEEHVDTDEDSLLYVYLCATCHGRLKHVGVRKAPPVDSDLLIV